MLSFIKKMFKPKEKYEVRKPGRFDKTLYQLSKLQASQFNIVHSFDIAGFSVFSIFENIQTWNTRLNQALSICNGLTETSISGASFSPEGSNVSLSNFFTSSEGKYIDEEAEGILFISLAYQFFSRMEEYEKNELTPPARHRLTCFNTMASNLQTIIGTLYELNL